VRELRSAVGGAAALSGKEILEPQDLPGRIREAAGAQGMAATAASQRLTLRELEQRYIQEVLRQTAGNKSRAAELLGLDRKTLYRKLREVEEEDEPAPPVPPSP
jgi:DNA-binding NtrC family response regulator